MALDGLASYHSQAVVVAASMAGGRQMVRIPSPMVGAAGRREDKAAVALSREDSCQPDARGTETEWIWWPAINHDVITTNIDQHMLEAWVALHGKYNQVKADCCTYKYYVLKALLEKNWRQGLPTGRNQ
jgi:hypothetical protein